ncbi:DNA-binding MarR family transcriptional regulator [Halorubrum alkaliphilum]|uniref:DNA-binding MarR family transcriptional regulator n=1 Tax=Halorubrum alkaliphilum TaxID=261290 RepID=A0A8T4GGM7_9EURY|nr:helix-turn-helix domain-containing protein [Halorubrum alkaliphilum]MBP1922877.1 DNA-binding MarR family transcriptional regulator [Halorubrum alkaliphilum]
MLTNAGISLIDALHRGREATINEIADETGFSTSQIYRTADELHTAGLIDESRGHHNQRLLRVTGHPVIEAYRNLLSKLGHVEWPNLLSPATIRICWFLNKPWRARTIADRLGITRQAVHNALDSLKNRAMLSPSGPEYALVPGLQPLHDFAEAVILHEHRTRVRRLAPSATVEWSDPERALVHVHTKDDTAALQAADEWEITGLARFAAFDLQFFLAGEPAFWYAPGENLTPAQVVCHSLVADTGSRQVSYALLLIEHADIHENDLRSIAPWYGLEPTASDMYAFLNGEVDQRQSRETVLPNPDEYDSLKSQYGVM